MINSSREGYNVQHGLIEKKFLTSEIITNFVKLIDMLMIGF